MRKKQRAAKRRVKKETSDLELLGNLGGERWVAWVWAIVKAEEKGGDT